jgi:ABC-2 type transport system ATP-binding protein
VSEATGPRLVMDGISKRFGSLLALDRVSLTLGQGEILGFVGPNGAGKTTAIHILLGFLHSTSGTGSLMGHAFDEPRARARVGYVPDTPMFFPSNAIDAVGFAARLSGVTTARPAIEDTLRRVGVQEWRRDVRKFSRGMQQRVALAQALIHDPEVLILDEPAAALDPEGVLDIRELLKELRDRGKSILFSSHQLGEVEEVSDRVAFLQRGRLLRYGPLEKLLGDGVPDSARTLRVVVRGVRRDAEPLRLFSPYLMQGAATGETAWQVPPTQQRALIEAAWNAGGELLCVEPQTHSLTELYLRWSREGAAGEAADA